MEEKHDNPKILKINVFQLLSFIAR